MGWLFQVYFVVPVEYLTEGNLASTVEALKHLSALEVDEFEPPNPDAPLFSSTPATAMSLDSWQMELRVRECQGDEDLWQDARDTRCLVMSIENAAIEDSPELGEALHEMMRLVFLGMGALYAVGATEFAFEEVTHPRDLVKVMGTAAMFSERVLLPQDKKLIGSAEGVCDLDGYGVSFLGDGGIGPGMNTELSGTFGALLQEVWRRNPRLNCDRSERA